MNEVKVNPYQPVLTTDYDFPTMECPLVTTKLFATDEQELSTPMKGIIRLDQKKVIAAVSDKYTLVPHKNVIDLAEKSLERYGSYKKEIYTTHNGARLYGEYKLNDFNDHIDGDEVGAMLIIRNSYDASSSVSISVQGLRLLCLNGLMGMGTIFSHGKRHVGEIDMSEDVTSNISNALSDYKDSAIPFWKKLAENKLSKDAGISIIKTAAEDKIIPQKYEDEIVDKWDTEARILNSWILYNCFTFILTHTIKSRSYENYMNVSRKISMYFKERFRM